MDHVSPCFRSEAFCQQFYKIPVNLLPVSLIKNLSGKPSAFAVTPAAKPRSVSEKIYTFFVWTGRDAYSKILMESQSETRVSAKLFDAEIKGQIQRIWTLVNDPVLS